MLVLSFEIDSLQLYIVIDSRVITVKKNIYSVNCGKALPAENTWL